MSDIDDVGIALTHNKQHGDTIVAINPFYLGFRCQHIVKQEWELRQRLYYPAADLVNPSLSAAVPSLSLYPVAKRRLLAASGVSRWWFAYRITMA